MIDKLIEGKLVTLIVGSVFRIVEILVRAVHVTIRGVRILVQERLTAPIDVWVSGFGKRTLAKRSRVDRSSIVLIESSGEYTGDPKYIAEEILRRGAPYEITWVLRDHSVGPYPGEFQFVRYGTADYFRAVAHAQVVVQNDTSLQDSGVVKSAWQQWLQTGSTRPASRPPRKRAVPPVDFVVTGSAFEDRAVTASSSSGVPTLMLGHARTDILVDTPADESRAIRKRVLDRLGITDTDQRFLLYAPARANDTVTAPLSGIDIAGVRAACAERFGGSWDVLIRTHASRRDQSQIWLAGLPAYCHDATFHPDLQELLVVADAGITDRADWIGDYLLTGRPAFCFSLHRRAARDVLDETPLSIATSNQELVHDISRFDQEAHDSRVARFLEGRGSIVDGGSSSRIVDRLDELMGDSR